MALVITPLEARELIDHGSSKGHVVAMLAYGKAYIVFDVDKSHPAGCHCLVAEADEEWMQEFMRLSRVIVRSDVQDTFIQAAESWWPNDQTVQRLRALYKFNTP